MRILIATATAFSLQAASAQGPPADLTARAGEQGIGGIGLASCASITGVRNAPLLAQAGDWMLGYMAGRVDAGQVLVEGEPLDAASSIDVVTSLATYCADRPEMTVLAAARRFGARVFGELPAIRKFEDAPARTALAAPPARPALLDAAASGEVPLRPMPRPGDPAPEAATLGPGPRAPGSAEQRD